MLGGRIRSPMRLRCHKQTRSGAANFVAGPPPIGLPLKTGWTGYAALRVPFEWKPIGHPLSTNSRWQALDCQTIERVSGGARSDDALHRPPGIGPSFSRFDNSYIRTKGMSQWQLIRGSALEARTAPYFLALAARSPSICVRDMRVLQSIGESRQS